MKTKPLVSVVIPTYNSDRFLGRCLKSVKSQNYRNIEIVVVDKYSTDKTIAIAKEYGARIILLEGIRSEARNTGTNSAKGEFILSLDSDMELTPNVVSKCMEKARQGFDAVIIPEISVGKGFWASCKALEKSCYVGDDLIEAPRFFKKEILNAVGGYDQRLETGEDWDICERIRTNRSIGRISALNKHNEGRLSLRDSMLKKRYYGKTLKWYKMKHPELAKRQLSLIRPAFIREWRKLLRSPSKAAGMFFMKMCEFTAWWLGTLSSRGVDTRADGDVK